MTIAAEGGEERSGWVGIALRDALPWRQLEQIVQTAEDTGYRAVFVPESAGREAFGTLAGLATATERIRLGTGVVTVRSRDPVTMAMAAATVQDLSDGRLVLGVGTGRPQGDAVATGPSPVDRIREYIQIVRRILTGDVVEAGGAFPVEGFQLSLPLTAGPPPIWVAALGDRMLSLAGAVADGVIMNWCTPERVGRARQIIHEAALRAGRDPAGVTISVYVRACLGVEESVGLAGLREMAGQYASIPHYRRQMETMGLGEEARVAEAAFERGSGQDVPEALVRALAVVGGRGEALARFAAYHDAGAELVLCYPVAVRDAFSSILGTVLAAAPSTAVER